MNPIHAADSSTPLPRLLASTNLPARTTPMRPGTPSAESARSSTGSQKSSSSRRRMACTRRRPPSGAKRILATHPLLHLFFGRHLQEAV